jgi:hypothetical protein
MSDQRPLTKIQWAVIIVAVVAFLFSLSKCSAPNTSPSHPVFSVPALKSTSPRRQISSEQRERMKALLTPYAGSRITMISTVGDEESQAFGAQLDFVFREAGWQTEVQTAMSGGPMPSIFLRVPKSHIPESKVKEFSNSATDVTLTIADLPPQDLALLKAFRVLEMDCPLETMDLPKDHIEVKIGSRP